jgi:hypothetical protein
MPGSSTPCAFATGSHPQRDPSPLQRHSRLASLCSLEAAALNQGVAGRFSNLGGNLGGNPGWQPGVATWQPGVATWQPEIARFFGEMTESGVATWQPGNLNSRPVASGTARAAGTRGQSPGRTRERRAGPRRPVRRGWPERDPPRTPGHELSRSGLCRQSGPSGAGHPRTGPRCPLAALRVPVPRVSATSASGGPREDSRRPELPLTADSSDGCAGFCVNFLRVCS